MTHHQSLRVVIPHFYSDGVSGASDGYGSGRPGNRLRRSVALARCLGSVLGLNRAEHDWILNIAERKLEPTPRSIVAGLQPLHVELHLFVCGEQWLRDVVDLFLPRLHLHCLELADPTQLPLVAVRQLLDMVPPMDLNLYLEDDLVIHDPLYPDKQSWFHQRTNHRCILMPHRREQCVANSPHRLFVDGPIKPSAQSKTVMAVHDPVVFTARYLHGQDQAFMRASNPHSGSFCLSATQVEQLRSATWPPHSFVGPLETAATGTVLGHFPILKPSWTCRDFLTVEHADPSFLTLLDQLPRFNLL